MDARRYLLFLCFGLLAMFAGEFQGQVLIAGSFRQLFLTLLLYAVLISVFFMVSARITSNPLYYSIAGLFGLLVVEWLFLGNFPGSGRGALHAGMFAWWAAVFTVPRMSIDDAAKPHRRRVWIALVAYSVISTLIAIWGAVAFPSVIGAVVGLMYAIGYITINFMMAPYLGGRWSWFMWLLVAGMVLQLLTW